MLGLQIFVSAFEEKNRSYDDNAKAISDKAWETAKTAVNGKDSDDFKNVAGNLSRSISENNSHVSANLVEPPSTTCLVLLKRCLTSRGSTRARM